MNENAIRVGDTVLDPTLLLLGVTGVAAFVLLIIVIAGMARRSAESAKRAAQTSHLEAELAELKSRLQMIAENSESWHEELTRATHRLGQNFTENWHKTYECFSKLNERMAVFHTSLNYLAVEVRVLTSKPGLLAAKRAFRRPLHR